MRSGLTSDPGHIVCLVLTWEKFRWSCRNHACNDEQSRASFLERCISLRNPWAQMYLIVVSRLRGSLLCCTHHTPAFACFHASLQRLSGATFRLLSARNPSDQSERQLIWDRQSGFRGPLSTSRWPLQQASSTLFALTDGEPSCYGGHSSLSGGTGHMQALRLSHCFRHCTPSWDSLCILASNLLYEQVHFIGG